MNRGEVVEVDWPYSDLSGAERRPAIVMQADDLNGLLDDTIFLKVQTFPYGIPGTEVRLDPAIETRSGLRIVCYVWCKDILTRDQAMVLSSVGMLLDAAMRQIEDCLKRVLQLP